MINSQIELLHDTILQSLLNTLDGSQSLFFRLQLSHFDKIEPVGSILVTDAPPALDGQNLSV